MQKREFLEAEQILVIQVMSDRVVVMLTAVDTAFAPQCGDP